MVRQTSQQFHQDQRTLQAFTCLLTLVEALSSITEQEQNSARIGEENAPPITLTEAGHAFAEIAQQVLDCKYVGVIALSGLDERQRLLGVSGLPPEEVAILERDTAQTPMADYVDASISERLHNDQVVGMDLQKQPFLTPRSIHGARFRLVAPMMQRGRLIGVFTMAKTDEEAHNLESAYTDEERALAKGFARLATQVIERVSLLQERAEARAKERQLQEATRRYEDCLSTASHEMRTPLTTIKGNLQLSQRRVSALAKRSAQSPETLEGLQRIELPLREALRNFDRLERMISELLDYSRIQANKFNLREQTVNLVEIVRDIVENARKTMDERAIVLTLPEQEMLPIYADKDRIGEVIHNYLTNAHKYSPLERPIEVSLSVMDEQARVAVRDEGTGIPPEQQPHVWERFYRVPGIEVVEQSMSDSNLGLGLYLCQEIIGLHHGQVGIESTPGQGSTFWFTLPLAEHEPAAF
ncbi:MAG TPA: GAF domain-containing sensor histidine kinase [Ktedonobacteraceae bacterium]|nr:GAF domain-containing sensor histidine kinase [Ktedonobacteraceae bacterium]